MRTGDIFSNIDEKTAERLSAEYPFPDDERKARLYAMSKRKFDMNEMPETGNNEVSGVEKYNRPRWYKGASIAAAAVLLVAGIGTSTVLISRNGKGPAAQVSEVTSAQVAENTSKAVTEAPTEAAVDPEAITRELMDKATSLFKGTAFIELDETDYIENTDFAHPMRFYKVTDKRFSSWEAVVNEYSAVYDEKTTNQLLGNAHCYGEDNITANTIYLTTDNVFYTQDRGIKGSECVWPEEDKSSLEAELTPDGNISSVFIWTYTDDMGMEWENTEKYTIVKTDKGWRIGKKEVESLAKLEKPTDLEAVAKKLIKGYVTLGVDLNSIECDNTVYIENSNPNYTKRFYKVTDKKYSKWEDIEKAYYEIYDKATADQMLENEHCCGEDNITDNTIYLTTDNGFYVEDTSNNLLLNPEEDKYDFNCSLTPEGEIICLCTYTYSGVECEYSGTTKYTIISTENGWRIANAELQTE